MDVTMCRQNILDVYSIIQSFCTCLGHGDYVKCFYCGITICHWEYEDDPFAEHVHWSPTCEFAKAQQRQNEK